jgi:hypothetical protein
MRIQRTNVQLAKLFSLLGVAGGLMGAGGALQAAGADWTQFGFSQSLFFQTVCSFSPLGWLIGVATGLSAYYQLPESEKTYKYLALLGIGLCALSVLIVLWAAINQCFDLSCPGLHRN